MSRTPLAFRLLQACSAGLVVLLAGCGGGGGGGADTSTSTPAGPTWSEQAYIKPANIVEGALFGTVALSGDTLVVGSHGESSSQTTITNGSGAGADTLRHWSGAVYVYVRNGSTWSQQAYIKAPNADANDLFGERVAISGDTLVVGARVESSGVTTITNGTGASADNSVHGAGAVYVFVRSGSNWAQQAYLKAPNADADDNFGQAVAISNDTIVVGASTEDSNQTTITNGNGASADNSAQDSGAAYVFVRNGANWSQQAYLKASNVESQDNFGSSVAISGDTIVVGSVFESSNQNTITNGSGASADNSVVGAGAAYVFVRTGTSWSQQAYLKAPNLSVGANFGSSVAISDNTIVVGAANESSSQTSITNGSGASADTSATRAGAAYVFVRNGTSWSSQAYLKASNAKAEGRFGNVIISGDTIVVGARGEASNQTTVTNGSGASSNSSAADAGAAYVFVRGGTSWSQQAYLKAANAGAGDTFGGRVAVSGDTIAVGAVEETSNQTTITNGSGASADNSLMSAGAAYVFKRAN